MTQGFLEYFVAFKISLDDIHSTVVFNVLTQALNVLYSYVSFRFVVAVVVVCLFVGIILLVIFVFHLSKSQAGFLHLVSTFVTCSFSILKVLIWN